MLATPHAATAAMVALAFAATPLATAELVAIDADKDNTIFEEGGLSNGAGDYFFAGVTGAGQRRRALLSFDIAGAVPAGATITDVTLTLHMSRGIGGAYDVALHRLQADWGEGASDAENEEGAGAPAEPGDATWNFSFFATDAWATAGGDFEATASAEQQVLGIDYYDWSSDQLTADVQSFLDTPSGNFGLALLSNEGEMFSAKRFDSRTNPIEAFRPELSVTYALPAPGALSLLAIALVRGRRRRD